MSNEIISGTMVAPSPGLPGGPPPDFTGLVSQVSNGEWSVSGTVPMSVGVVNLPEGGTNGPLFAIDNNAGFGTFPVTATLDGHVYDISMRWLSAGYVAASTPGVHTGTFDANINLFGLPGDEVISAVGRGTISATWGYVSAFGEQFLTVVSPVNYTFKNVPEPSTLALFVVALLICVVRSSIRSRLRPTSQMACAGLPRCTA